MFFASTCNATYLTIIQYNEVPWLLKHPLHIYNAVQASNQVLEQSEERNIGVRAQGCLFVWSSVCVSVYGDLCVCLYLCPDSVTSVMRSTFSAVIQAGSHSTHRKDYPSLPLIFLLFVLFQIPSYYAGPSLKPPCASVHVI